MKRLPKQRYEWVPDDGFMWGRIIRSRRTPGAWFREFLTGVSS